MPYIRENSISPVRWIPHLGQFKNNREAFIDAAKKLTPEETADLMMSYEKRLLGGEGGEGGEGGDEAITSPSVGEIGRVSATLAPSPIHALGALQSR